MIFNIQTPTFNANRKTCSFVKGLHILQDKFILLGNDQKMDLTDEQLLAAVHADKHVQDSQWVHIEIVHVHTKYTDTSRGNDAPTEDRDFRFVIIAGLAPEQYLDENQRWQRDQYQYHREKLRDDGQAERVVAEAACKHYGIRWQF